MDRVPAVRPAAFSERVVAWIIDGFVIVVVTFLTIFPWAAVDDRDGKTDEIFGLWWLLTVVTLNTLYLGLPMRRRGDRNGQTWGKRAMDIRVVRDNQQPVTFATVLLREVLLKFVLGTVTVVGWLVDGLWPLRERRQRALHDLGARTHVVSTLAPPALPAPPARPQSWRRPQLLAVHTAAIHVGDAIAQSPLPFAEVSRELDALLAAAQRADDDQLERLVTELEALRSSILGVSSGTDRRVQEHLAAWVAALRASL